jgi:DNA modification methylase
MTLAQVVTDHSWNFTHCSVKDTSYISHSYYTYPAKFIPQLAQRLIIEHSRSGDLVVDSFMGSGTTIVESLITQRSAIGVDINEIAFLVSKVKTTPIEPLRLATSFLELKSSYLKNKQYPPIETPTFVHERIDYWYKETQKKDLIILLHTILKIDDVDIKDFFLVAFAQILKTCSIWLQKSVKPTRDLNKKESDVFDTFNRHATKMIKKADEFYRKLTPSVIKNIEQLRIIKCQDARQIPCEDNRATLVVTSPPYVTSYEYADLHQLPLYWLGHLEELSQFRQKFIGSSFSQRIEAITYSKTAEDIINKLTNKKKQEVANYFADMYEVFIEMHRLLKPQGKACIVIGNTQFRGIEIKNAEVFVEQMQHIGFQVFDIIKREIPSKMLPSTRDDKTGRFSKITGDNLTLAYPTEYILIMQKGAKK